ncbi:IgGFc-binding protein-like [Gastrophryne carolinensis]
MHGSENDNKLKISVKDDTNTYDVWQRSGQQGSDWLFGSVTFASSRENNILVTFTAIRGLTEYGDIAIDNIGVKNGACGTPTTTVSPSTTISTTTKPTAPPDISGGTCSGYGDPHYMTFDGFTHTFMGNCTYTLSKLCEPNSSLPFFNVEAAHEYRGGNTQVSYVKEVTVYIHSYKISLQKEKVVKVDDLTQQLPVSLSPDVYVGLSGQYVDLIAAFGLRVKYDGNHRVEVTLSKAYQNQVCGICANYNEKRGDDNLNPNGGKETDSTSYGNSWQVANDTSCFQAATVIPNCTLEEIHEIQNSCGKILPFDGPFQHCHLLVDPRDYFEKCFHDMCALHLDPDILCSHLQAYADACQAAGGVVLPWRNATFCPLDCPPNSHYEQCGTACPATCVNPGSPSNCNLPCTEGCVCDPGYVLYDKMCVPATQCGCWEDGIHYPVDSEFWTDDTCSTRCTCPSAGGSLVCNSASCPPGKYCGITNGVPDCTDFTFGNCVIYGDPHYTTFDKENHHFMGICTYTLSKLCSNYTSLPYFNIEAKNEHRYGNPSVSWIKKVMVEVYDHKITIVKDEPSRVLVDGLWTNLPVFLANGSLSVLQSGRYITLETAFLLTVTYDTDHTVDVKLPTTYFNQTCGMCGNFNGMHHDDYFMPNGQLAQNTNQLGESWQVMDEDDPFCGTIPPPPPICPPSSEELYSSNQFCGLITSKDNAFKACHSVINPDRFFESCVYDLCALGEDTLCKALEAYADACQRAGIIISWRNSTFCPIPCNGNAHYNSCSSACPATCLDPNAPNNCNKPCTDACECDDGFVLSGTNCVPVSECGCFYDGKYYQKDETIWTGECESHCTCIGNNHMSCVSQTCAPHEVCKVQNGIKTCVLADTSICHIYGDPHYVTFDGKPYNFMGSCNYTAVETCGNTTQNFQVTTRNEHRGSPTWTAINSVAVRIADLHIILKKKKVVEINGVIMSPPVNPAPGISVILDGSYVVVQTNFGLEVKFNGDQELIVKITENFKGQLCGLCGTYNDNQQDDFLTPAGSLAATANDFGKSWRVPDANWTCEDDIVDPPPCDPAEETKYEDQCELILSGNGPFKNCHNYIRPQLYFENCVYDLCATGGNQDQFCSALEAYAAACENVGITIGDWRENTICEITTTETPTTTTPHTPDPSCSIDCSFDVDMCNWRQSGDDDMDWIRWKGPTPSGFTGPSYDHTTGDGYYLFIDGSLTNEGSFARLESPSNCFTGSYCLHLWYHMYGVARSMMLRVAVLRDDGLEFVTTKEGNYGDLWHLEKIYLPASGIRQIFIEGFRGDDYRSDVAIDDISLHSGYCDSTPTPTTTTTTMITTITTTSTSTVSRSTSPTTTPTTTPPLPPGYCEVNGDPHYYTFDNEVHHFMGNCTYTLSKLCEVDGHLAEFNVEAANEHRGGNTRVSYVKYVNVDVHGYRITLEQKREVKVDGERVNLPAALHPNVNIFVSGNDVLLTTGFGVSVSFDGNHRVVVNIPGEYAGKVCGICGNFNGNRTDDFLNPDGELEPDSNSLGNSWQVENDTRCNTTGGGTPPACSDDEKDIISSNNFCGIITDKNGPFKNCHGVIDPLVYFTNCFYDLCELNLNPGALCDSLLSYAQACQAHGVSIGPWRNDSFCPLECPPNSHYEPCGTACPASCVYPGSPSTCNLPCKEACICNPGFVLYDKMCVPSTQCGCWENGTHYPVGPEFWTDDTCSKTCQCLSNGGSLVCNPASCPPGKYCGISNGVPGCYDLTFGNCVIYGDPHYTTFDKETHHFMGICTYTLSKLCSNYTSLPYFNIEAKNEHRGNPTVSWIKRVTVEVYGHSITIVKNEPSRVLVDGIWRNLPVILVNGSVTVTQSGRYVILETDFHLTVSYDTDHTVDVKLPTTFFNETCGICGNFNGMPGDDYLMPNGQLAQNSNQLGESWQVQDDDPACTVPPTVPPPILKPCLPEAEEYYSSNQFCGLLTDKNGPFKACHSVVNPDRFLEGCVFDLCVLGNDTLCKALEVYADACQRAGVVIAWRNSTFCSIPCDGPNSHYNSCASACPATCLNPNAPNNCNKPCTDACECDHGFVLSGQACVPLSECGCFYDGKYYPKDETLWEGECERYCTCEGNNQMNCSLQTCAPNEVCQVQNGIKDCFPIVTSTTTTTTTTTTTPTSTTSTVTDKPSTTTTTSKPGSTSPPTISTSTSFTTTVIPSSTGTYTSTSTATTSSTTTTRPTTTSTPAPSSTTPDVCHIDCSFDISLCNWKQSVDDDMDWIRWKGATPSSLTGPSYDHTTGAQSMRLHVSVLRDDGLEIVTQIEGNHGDVWHLEKIYLPSSDIIQIFIDGVHGEDFRSDIAIDDIALVPGYCIGSAVPSTIKTSTTTGTVIPSSTVTSTSTSTASPSTTTSPTTTTPPPSTPTPAIGSTIPPIIDTSTTTGTVIPSSTVASTSTSTASPFTTTSPITTTPPPSTPTPGLPSTVSTTVPTSTATTDICHIDCSFDINLCNWKQSVDDNMDWIRWKGATPSDLTGPSYDHTTGDGYYLFIDGRYGSLGDFARLESPANCFTGSYCLYFWYHMYGSAQSMRLHVSVLRDDGLEIVTQIEGNQGDKWHLEKIYLPSSDIIQIFIDGIIGDDFRSDIAIDDISLVPGYCVDSTVSPSSISTSPTTASTTRTKTTGDTLTPTSSGTTSTLGTTTSKETTGTTLEKSTISIPTSTIIPSTTTSTSTADSTTGTTSARTTSVTPGGSTTLTTLKTSIAESTTHLPSSTFSETTTIATPTPLTTTLGTTSSASTIPKTSPGSTSTATLSTSTRATAPGMTTPSEGSIVSTISKTTQHPTGSTPESKTPFTTEKISTAVPVTDATSSGISLTKTTTLKTPVTASQPIIIPTTDSILETKFTTQESTTSSKTTSITPITLTTKLTTSSSTPRTSTSSTTVTSSTYTSSLSTKSTQSTITTSETASTTGTVRTTEPTTIITSTARSTSSSTPETTITSETTAKSTTESSTRGSTTNIITETTTSTAFTTLSSTVTGTIMSDTTTSEAISGAISGEPTVSPSTITSRSTTSSTSLLTSITDSSSTSSRPTTNLPNLTSTSVSSGTVSITSSSPTTDLSPTTTVTTSGHTVGSSSTKTVITTSQLPTITTTGFSSTKTVLTTSQLPTTTTTGSSSAKTVITSSQMPTTTTTGSSSTKTVITTSQLPTTTTTGSSSTKTVLTTSQLPTTTTTGSSSTKTVLTTSQLPTTTTTGSSSTKTVLTTSQLPTTTTTGSSSTKTVLTTSQLPTTTTTGSSSTKTVITTSQLPTTTTSVSTGMCEVSGDPHYYTYDKQVHHFMGTCTYTLSKLCEDNSNLTVFNVEAANEHRNGNTRVSYVKYVNVDVYGYRITLDQQRIVKVKLKCPPNSHYQHCGAACPATCVNPGAPSTCTLPCTESCVCDPGYLLYGTKCVPDDKCGCWDDDDKHYNVGSSFWTDDTCSIRCRCPSPGSALTCSADSCPSNQYCGISNGKPGCQYFTYGVCRVHNDPHYDTFDRLTHDFMGLCTYTLSKLCNSSSSSYYFNIEAKNEHRGDPKVSFVKYVLVEVYGQKVQIMKNEKDRVLVNKIWKSLPVQLVNGAVHVSWTGKYVSLQTDFKLTVSYDVDTSVDVKLPSNFSSLTCGMCGNFNGLKSDDFIMPNGQQAQTSEQLGHTPDCPVNSHFSTCASACPATCLEPSNPDNCSLPCSEGCECDPGFVISGGSCVAQSHCGCFYNGQYYRMKSARSKMVYWAATLQIQQYATSMETLTIQHMMAQSIISRVHVLTL